MFLDVQSLVPGMEWGRALLDALTRSGIVVVLISDQADASYYKRDEIAMALQLARHGSSSLRVVPVWLSRRAGASADVPYGLRGIQGLDAEELGLNGVARALLDLRNRLAHVAARRPGE